MEYECDPGVDLSPGSSSSSGSNCTTVVSDEYLEKLDIIYSQYPVEDWKRLGLYDDSMLETLDIHWLKFSVPSFTTHLTFAIIYGIIMLIGLCGNLLTLIVFYRCRSLRSPANYLILNLTISDFLLLAKIPIFILNSLYRGPVIGAVGCQLYGFIGGVSGTAAIMTLCCIALDRYHVIVHPMNPFKKTTYRRALLMILFVWVYSLVFGSIPILYLGGYVPEGLLTSCSFDYLKPSLGNRIFIFIYFIGAWFLPLSLIIFSYASIFRVVLQAEKISEFQKEGSYRITPTRSSRSRESRIIRKEVKITVITSVIILCWVLAWTPYAIVALLGIFGQKDHITPLISAIPALFCKTAACIDPLIYSLNHPKFRKELGKLPLCSAWAHGLGRKRTTQDTSSHYFSASNNGAEEYPLSTQVTYQAPIHSGGSSSRRRAAHQSDYGSIRTSILRNRNPVESSTSNNSPSGSLEDLSKQGAGSSSDEVAFPRWTGSGPAGGGSGMAEAGAAEPSLNKSVVESKGGNPTSEGEVMEEHGRHLSLVPTYSCSSSKNEGCSCKVLLPGHPEEDDLPQSLPLEHSQFNYSLPSPSSFDAALDGREFKL